MRARFMTAAGLGLIGVLSLAPAASADTATIGAAATPGTLFGGAANFTALQQTTDPVSPSFAAPSVPAGGGPWSVTSWSALGGTGNGSASLEIWRPTGTSGEFRLIAIGPQQPFPTGVVTSHPVSIPVLPGDDLGILTGPDTDFSPTYSSGKVGDAAIWSNTGTPAVGQTMGGPSSDFTPHGGAADARVNVQATLISTPAVAVPPAKAKCKKKKKKHKRSASSSKKKKCKKHKKR